MTGVGGRGRAGREGRGDGIVDEGRGVPRQFILDRAATGQ